MNKVHCNEKDMSTLLNFKGGVIDPSGMLSSWSTQHDCCEWFGVHCGNITGRVTELYLPCHTIPSPYIQRGDKSNCLTGELHLSLLLGLEFLNYLNLSDNDFKTIQYNTNSAAGNHGYLKYSSNLHYLDLSYNDDIVINNLHWISNLSSLEHLKLNGINLHKETDWLSSMVKLPSLVELHMKSCQLQTSNPFLQYANFTSLQVLNLAENGFGSKLPSWLFNLSCDISHINLKSNNIFGQLPQTLPISQSIKYLDLSSNNLDGPIPNWFGQLEHLQELYLSANSFTGPIPLSLGNVSSLITLDLGINHLNGSLPINLGKLVNLKYLGVDENSLTGLVSQRNFFSLSNLRKLYLSSPALIFDFDPEWIPPFQLDLILLGYVGPELPLWLFTQSNLRSLNIEYSKFSFKPHDKFWNFAPLEVLSLYNNTIEGDMSNVLLTSKIAWLSTNNLRGGLPRISANVIILHLSTNNLHGSISPLLCHKIKEKSNLEYLDVSQNQLSGGLTDCWMQWKSLLHVDLGYNNFTGRIPQSMGLLSNLISLSLDKNNLFGEVPLSLKNCQNLRILNLNGNKFSGGIPYWIGKSMIALQLRSNEFSGNIPPQICQLNSLKVLDFANNRLFGQIPNCLHNITSMVTEYASFDHFTIIVHITGGTIPFTMGLFLLIKGSEYYYPGNLVYLVDLSKNSLSGTIPLEIYELTRLQSLNLSHNQLMGMIPQEIGNLKQLESIDLSSNRLSGEIPQSMSGLSYLGDLNLSFNNFMGKIPSGTQLEGFTNLSYIGNPNLCGPPLTNNCPQVEKSNHSKPTGEDDEESEVHWWSWFYMGMGIGFATGFWAVLGAIFFNRTCRHAYFGFLNKLYVILIIKVNRAKN
ncbi:hypothetical protein RIF29_26774 [Crotalaria pallida]|uniref:Leucine-rich repeat-containing N-terminal plant-type domain-containing protein n=1 Tax=Crotalaria pallida TaxID=3830 RepID=A0AAN9EP11_CROPI